MGPHTPTTHARETEAARETQGAQAGREHAGDWRSQHAGAQENEEQQQEAEAEQEQETEEQRTQKYHRRLCAEIVHGRPGSEGPPFRQGRHQRRLYTKGKRTREPGYMYMPETCKEYDDDGTEKVIKFITPIWGSTEAGFEWDTELHSRLCEIGWRQCEGCPAMYYFDSPESDCRLVKIVDDLGFSESSAEQSITKATIAALKEAYNDELTSDLAPTSFAGYKINIVRDSNGTSLSMSQHQKVVEAVKKYMPELLEGTRPADILVGAQLTELLESLHLPDIRPSKLSPDQKTTQCITGDLKYFERGSMPRLSRMVHRLSCCMGCPPANDGIIAARSVLYHAYTHRHDKLTYGASPTNRADPIDGRLDMKLTERAPTQLEASADALTTPRDVYSVLITYGGASVLHKTKKIGIAVGSTHDAENVATVKASEDAIYGRIVLHALGVPQDGPTLLMTDNLTNMRVAQNAQSAARSRFFLIRSVCLHQRITDGDLQVVHVPDPENPADFLTKFIGGQKTEASAAYCAGRIGAAA